MTLFDWSNFARVTRESDHWPLMERAAALVGHVGDALDLGAGGGRDTRFLLAHGWHVTAVDSEPESIGILSETKDDNLTIVQSAIQDFNFGHEKYDLVSAQFSLPFVPTARLAGVISSIKEALRPGGVFTGQFFGPRDEWNKPGSNITFLPQDKVEELLDGMEVIELAEEQKMGSTVSGSMKHWHVFHVIARKPSA